jgi:hypothetical protein
MTSRTRLLKSRSQNWSDSSSPHTSPGLARTSTRCAKMEAADPTVSVDLLLRALFALGAKRRDIVAAIQKGQPTAA